ncbi:hypothetical protein [Erythrobacter tepidarius]|uniref:hypothetical protein n=1 Tax=Erythrobacter tepidarius TaxID=60454 RepID=UPI000A365B70|nr:hypothetical protein [Erythrobacter tepidarius]
MAALMMAQSSTVASGLTLTRAWAMLSSRMATCQRSVKKLAIRQPRARQLRRRGAPLGAVIDRKGDLKESPR